MISDHTQHMELGYKQFMEEIYGDNIIFSDGKLSFILFKGSQWLTGLRVVDFK